MPIALSEDQKSLAESVAATTARDASGVRGSGGRDLAAVLARAG